MKISTIVLGVGVAAASLPAQTFVELPSTTFPSFELPNFSQIPFMQPNARVQMFYDDTEVGTTPLLVDELALRYDGPIPQVGAPGPFSIQQLTIRVGTTAIPTPGADFAANLTQPLTTVYSGPWSYLPDNGSAAPHPWGGPGDSLRFPFQTQVPVALQAGEWLVVDVTMVGNDIQNFGFAHAILDGANTTGGVTNGAATAYGQGCSAGAGLPAASVGASGVFAPGAAHVLTGQNLGANAPVVGIFGLSNSVAFAPLPFTLPGTSCALLASPDFTPVVLASGTGAVGGEQLVLSLPADPAINGVVLYEQLASLVPAANPSGIRFSNGGERVLGGYTALGRGTYTVAHDNDASASFANVVRAFGYALQLRTL